MSHHDTETCRSKGYQIDFMTVVFRGLYQRLIFAVYRLTTWGDDSEHITLRMKSGGWRFGCSLSFLPLCDRPPLLDVLHLIISSSPEYLVWVLSVFSDSSSLSARSERPSVPPPDSLSRDWPLILPQRDAFYLRLLRWLISCAPRLIRVKVFYTNADRNHLVAPSQLFVIFSILIKSLRHRRAPDDKTVSFLSTLSPLMIKYTFNLNPWD